MNRSLISVFVLGLWLLAQPCKAAKEFQVHGKVVYVNDGDTLVILRNGTEQMKARLSSIDAPESSHTNRERGRVGQPFAERSKAFLASIVKGREVLAKCFERDRYDRSVCEIFLDGRSVNRTMVREGMAWANTAAHGKYLRDRELPILQSQARAHRAGLWSGRAPIEPWNWRKTCWEQSVCIGAE